MLANPFVIVGDLSVDPSDARTLAGVTPRSFAISRDGGASWQFSGPDDARLLRHPTRPSVFYMFGGFDGIPAQVLRSADLWRTWTGSQGITGRVTALAVDPRNADRLSAISEQGAWASVDGGLTWTLRNDELRRSELLLADPVRAGTLYAAAPSSVTENGFVMLLTLDGGTVASSYLGSMMGGDRVTDLATGRDGRIHVLGDTSFSDRPFAGAMRSHGNGDVVVTTLAPADAPDRRDRR